jgi:sulfide:quinone oxidoreductase
MKRVVIVGAGSGGTLLANLLAHEFHSEIGDGQVSVHLVGESDDHFFQPGNLDIAFRGADPESMVRKESSLLSRQVVHITEGAAKVDVKTKSLTTRSGSSLPYDHIVFATGATAKPELMAGLREGSLNFHEGPKEAAKIWEALQGFKRGKIVVAITSVPHKCPPSPNEAAFMLDEFFRRRGTRDSVQIRFLTPYPRAYPSESISDVIQPMFEKRGIQIVPFFASDHVDPIERRIFNMEGESESYDLLIAIPPHRGADVVRDSGLGDEEGWIPADKHTMKVKDHPEAYAIGDATGIAISKSGVVAHLQAEAVARNLASELRGGREVFEYNGRINCPMETGHQRALFVAGTYDTPPRPERATLLRYAMKKEFAKIYWSTIQGGWSWLMDAYFGETSEPHELEAKQAETRGGTLNR